jgi:non-heme chloroperoxidase
VTAARKLASLAALAGAGLAAVTVSARRRWEGADDPTDGRPLELPPGTERTVVSPDGARIAVSDMGDASRPPIVLAHGWTADRRVWASVARRLVASGHHVVVYDQRGHGGSSAGDAGFTVVALAEDLRAVLEHLDARDAVLAGHSMGGMAAQAFAVAHKDVLVDRVSHLVLVATAARSPLLGGPGSRYERAAIAATSHPTVARAVASERLGPHLVRFSLGAHPSMVALRATQESLVACPPETRSGFLHDMAALDLTTTIGSITVPTTVVYGSRDALTFPALNRQIAELIPGARTEVLHGAGHQLVFEAPDQLADVLADAAAGPRRA